MIKSAIKILLAGVIALSLVTAAKAQQYPTKPIRLVVSYPPGGGTDLVARILAKHLSGSLGQQFLVDNRGGANGTIGTNLVAKSAPDGYTLIVVSGSPFVINQVMIKELPYNILTDFEPVGLFSSQPLLLLIHPSIPAHSLKEFVAYAKSRPEPLNYAGTDQLTFLAMEMIKRGVGMDFRHIPYKGGGPALSDLLGGHVSALLGTVGVALPYVQSGKLRAIAITSAERSPVFPEVPTISDTAIPGYDVGAWFGLLAPAKTPHEIVEKLNAEVAKAMQSTEVRERFIALGGDTKYLPPSEFKQFLRKDLDRWKKAVEEAGVAPQ